MTIAITGGTGFVGQTLIDRALGAGLAVQALTRKRQDKREGLEWIKGDLDHRHGLGQLAERAEAVIHVAGLVNGSAEAFEQCNVQGTLNVIEAAIAAGVPRFIFVSSLSAREPELSAYGASKLRAEKLVRASGLDWTIVRPPGVYGPQDRSYFDMFRLAKWGVIPVPPLAGHSSLIHVDDLARLLLALLPGGEAVTHLSFEPDDGKRGGWAHYELARAIGWAVGRRPWVIGLSRKTMARLARIDMALRRGKAQLTLDRAGYLSHPDWVVGEDAAVPEAIWRPEIETREGLKATANWYREQGWL